VKIQIWYGGINVSSYHFGEYGIRRSSELTALTGSTWPRPCWGETNEFWGSRGCQISFGISTGFQQIFLRNDSE